MLALALLVLTHFFRPDRDHFGLLRCEALPGALQEHDHAIGEALLRPDRTDLQEPTGGRHRRAKIALSRTIVKSPKVKPCKREQSTRSPRCTSRQSGPIATTVACALGRSSSVTACTRPWARGSARSCSTT